MSGSVVKEVNSLDIIPFVTVVVTVSSTFPLFSFFIVFVRTKNPEVSSGGALRYNSGKPQFSHLSPDFIMEMMKGMTAANEKYPYLNYTKKQDVRTAADSLMRHFLKFQQGMDIDEELNTHHLALVAINAMIMFQNLQDFGDEVDNRYSKEKDNVQNGTR